MTLAGMSLDQVSATAQGVSAATQGASAAVQGVSAATQGVSAAASAYRAGVQYFVLGSTVHRQNVHHSTPMHKNIQTTIHMYALLWVPMLILH